MTEFLSACVMRSMCNWGTARIRKKMLQPMTSGDAVAPQAARWNAKEIPLDWKGKRMGTALAFCLVLVLMLTPLLHAGSKTSSSKGSSSKSTASKSISTKSTGSTGYHYVQPSSHAQGHYRTNPNPTTRDNWSTKGNVNPFTGKPGTKNP